MGTRDFQLTKTVIVLCFCSLIKIKTLAPGGYVSVPGLFIFSRLCLTFPYQGLTYCGGENNAITPHFQKPGGDHLCLRLSVGCPSYATLPTGWRRYELYVSESVLADLLIASPPPHRGEAPGLCPPRIYIYIYIYTYIYIYIYILDHT